MISGLTYTVRTTGFFSLYRGLAPTLLGSMPKAGIRFGGNSELKKVKYMAVSGRGGGGQRVCVCSLCGFGNIGWDQPFQMLRNLGLCARSTRSSE